MRMNRIKVSGASAVYHCIARVVAGQRLLGEVEQEVLRRQLWRVAGFSGAEVLSYCILSNHLHVLVRVPFLEGEALSRAEILRRYAILYGDGDAPEMPDTAVLAAIFEDPESEKSIFWENRLRTRMNDVSEFMKTLKQRFTIWYNHTHGRFGTLWSERFKSMLIEDHPPTLAVVAAYIDLNPVRAGIVEDPADYRFSGYGEAMGGQAEAQRGLASVVGQKEWAAAATDYRLVLFGKGADGRIGEQACIPREKVLEVLGQGGKVPVAQALRCRMRFFSDGVVLGSSAFVLEMASRFGSAARRKRRSSPTSLPIEQSTSLVILRRPRGRAYD